MRTFVIAVLLWGLSASSASAELLTVLSYDMPNGSGQASGGSYNYWDLPYNGSGGTTTDGAPLSGGVGDLTDGVVSPNPWFDVENTAGTGPFVGWINVDPLLTFHFSGVTSYGTIRVHVDDTNSGGVSAPGRIIVDDGQGHSSLFDVSDVHSGSVRWIDLDVSGLGLSGDQIQLTLFRSNTWIFSDEIQFLGATVVPEPGSIVGALFGLVAVGAIAARRRPSPNRL